jgi:hypothetical protein
MDFFQGAVETYLRADRASFNNPEFYLQRAEKYESGKTNWYVDVLNVNFEEQTVYLCEVTYAKNPTALRNRLKAWSENWSLVRDAIHRDAKIPDHWMVRVWIFCPEDLLSKVIALLPNFDPLPRITTLEMVLPWKYSDWNRKGEEIALKKNVPEQMRK